MKPAQPDEPVETVETVEPREQLLEELVKRCNAGNVSKGFYKGLCPECDAPRSLSMTTAGCECTSELCDWKGSLEQLRAALDVEDPVGEAHCTDLGNARRLVARHGADLRYMPWAKKWLVFDGRRFAFDDDGEVVRRAKETVGSIYEEASQARDTAVRKQLASWATRSESEARIRAMIVLASTEPCVPVKSDDLDSDPWAFNVLNGTIDLRTGELRPHDRRDLITKLADVEYDPDASADLFRRFLEQITASDALAEYLQRCVGCSLAGAVLDHVLFLLYGIGANGKSTFLEVIRAMMGDYAKQADASSFMVARTDIVRNDIARLAGARMVTAVEADEGKRLAEAVVKTLTGGDTVTARFLYGEFFEFKPVFTPWIATNHKPVIRGTDYAIWRRIRLLPFTVSIPPSKQDKALGQKLLKELPGILTWAVEGALAWHEDGLQEPEVVQKATRAYREEMDPLAGFLEDRCVFEDGAAVTAKELYAGYLSWATANGEKPISQTMLGRKLAEREVGTDKGGPSDTTRRLGLRLRRVAPSSYADPESTEGFSGESHREGSYRELPEKRSDSPNPPEEDPTIALDQAESGAAADPALFEDL